MKQLNLPFAFTIEGYIDKETKDDTRYVKSFARSFRRTKGIEYETIISTRECTSSDFDSFADPTEGSYGLFHAYKRGDRKLICLDWEKHAADLELWGAEYDIYSYQRFEWIVVPCNYVHAEVTPTDDHVAEECIADREKQMEYLGNIRLVWLMTQNTFIQTKFDASKIVT